MVRKKSGLIIILLLVLAAVTEAVNGPPRPPVGTWEIGTRYLDGTPFDPDIDVLDIGESLYLSVYSEEEFFWPSGFGYFWALVCDPSLSSITGGIQGPDAYLVGFYGSPVGHLYGVPGDGQHGWFGYEFSPEYPPGLYLDNFLYSPQSVGYVAVTFWHISEGLDSYGIVDSIVIHQVPEPMTIVLLGLGGLLLRRRWISSK